MATTRVGAPGTEAGPTGWLGSDAAPLPTELAAVTVKVYAVPLIRPATVHEVAPAGAAHVARPGLEVTVKPDIGSPPFDAGAAQKTRATELPASAVTPEGVPGTVAGVTGALEAEGSPVPAELVAVTVNT